MGKRRGENHHRGKGLGGEYGIKGSHSLQEEQNERKNPKISQCVYWRVGEGKGKGGGVQNKRSFGSITIHQAVRTARDTLSHYTESAGGGGTAYGVGGGLGARAGRGPHSFLHGHTHSRGMDVCVCVVGNPGGGGQGRGPCMERVPAPGLTLLVPL